MAKSRARGKYAAAMHRYSGSPNVRYTDPMHIMYGLPYGGYEMNFPVYACHTAAITSGLTANTATCVAIPLQEGMNVRRVAVMTAGAAGTPTASFVALYDTQTTPALMTGTGNLTTTAWAANSIIIRDFQRPVTIPITGVYYVAINQAATTLSTLVGAQIVNAAHYGTVSGSPTLSFSVAVTSGTAPATLATPTTKNVMPWVCLLG